MTATDTIRAMLDEHGVKWEACRVPTLRSELAATFWYDRDGNPCSAVGGADDIPDGKLSVNANLTPEQAIEATLGRGECRNISPRADWKDNEEFTCSECGFDGTYELGIPNYCPHCGAKVVRA